MQKPVRPLALMTFSGLALVLLPVSNTSHAAPNDGRFALVMDGAAVKDNQTGLFWEQEPDREHDVWSRSNERCAQRKSAAGKVGAALL